ncbi:hypothetical protein V3C99_008700, partial [Haemonchus contortus]
STRAEQRETRGVESIEESRGSSEDDKENSAPRPPSRHCGPSCFVVHLRNLDSTKAG